MTEPTIRLRILDMDIGTGTTDDNGKFHHRAAYDSTFQSRGDIPYILMPDLAHGIPAGAGIEITCYTTVEKAPEPEFGGPRPEIVTLCGSTRFKDTFNAVNAEMTMAGTLVISLGVFGHTDMPDRDWSTGGSGEKVALDELHKRKIDLADRVLVINVNGYIGDSTRSEIEYAKKIGRPVTYLES